MKESCQKEIKIAGDIRENSKCEKLLEIKIDSKFSFTTHVESLCNKATMFCQILFSLQVKRCTIITYKHGTYKLSHELPNDLRLRVLENISKVFQPHRMIA